MATTTYGTPYVSGTDLVANWPAASLTVANSIDSAGYYIGRGINAQTASYTGVLTDAGKTVTMTVGTANVFNIPANSSVAYVIGTRINILNLGAGACTVTALAGVTVNGTIAALTANQSATILKTATDTWSYIPAPLPGWNLITPISVAGSGVTLSGGQISVAASASASVNGCFTSTYDNYVIVGSFLNTSTGTNTLRLRVAGTDSTTTYSLVTAILGATYSSSTETTYIRIGDNGTEKFNYTVSLSDVFAAAVTSIYGCGNDSRPTQTFATGGVHTSATSYDGFTVACSAGVMTGTLRVYGLRNS